MIAYCIIGIFYFSCFIALLLRLFNIGWLLIALLPLEYLLRSGYVMLAASVLRRNLQRQRYGQILILQTCYLLASLFSYDGGDSASYTVLGLWHNPPQIMQYVAYGLYALTAFLAIKFYWHARVLPQHGQQQYVLLKPWCVALTALVLMPALLVVVFKLI